MFQNYLCKNWVKNKYLSRKRIKITQQLNKKKKKNQNYMKNMREKMKN